MAEHGTSTRTAGPTTPEALLEDRQRFWSGFTHATLAAVIVAVIVLAGMAVLL